MPDPTNSPSSSFSSSSLSEPSTNQKPIVNLNNIESLHARYFDMSSLIADNRLTSKQSKDLGDLANALVALKEEKEGNYKKEIINIGGGRAKLRKFLLKDGDITYTTREELEKFIAEKEKSLREAADIFEKANHEDAKSFKEFVDDLYSAPVARSVVSTANPVATLATEPTGPVAPPISTPQATPVSATVPVAPVRNRPAFNSSGLIAQKLNEGQSSKSTSAPTEQADKSQNNNVAYRVAIIVAWTAVEVGNMVIMSSIIAVQIQSQPQSRQLPQVEKDQSLQPADNTKPTTVQQNTHNGSLEPIKRMMHHMSHLHMMHHHLALALVMTAAFAVAARSLAEELENSQQFKADSPLAASEESEKTQTNSWRSPFATPTLVRGKA